MRQYKLLSVVCLLAFSFPALAGHYNLMPVKQILDLPDKKIDLAYAKLLTDKMINPSINIPDNIKVLDSLVADIQRPLLGRNLSQTDKLLVLLTYIYDKGYWNNNQVFEYDLDDPFGKDIQTKLLPHYLDTRKGNCVSMPMLLVILSQKLDINLVLVRAPTHLFTHFTDESGKVTNIEGVSKGTISDERYRNEFYITEDAIKNGIYLQSLTRKQMVIEMLGTVAEYYSKTKQYDGVMAITDLMLQYDPKSVDAMLRRGSTYPLLGDAFLKAHNYRLNQSEEDQMQAFRHNNNFWFKKAESLGWREPPQEFKDRYVALIEKAKAERQQVGGIVNEVH